ncbi:MAG: hypothetical protein LBG27_14285 [Spirochaetaceae bacterium]|nr:hypothetical protein [Spirochaetaceae bacterium]
MKKFFFGMAVLLSVSLFLIGCPTETEEKIVTNTVLLQPDKTVTTSGDNGADLKTALATEGVNIVAFAPASPVTLSTAPLVVPTGKTLQLLGGLTTASNAGVVVEGKVIVGAGGVLTATAAAAKISVKSGGRIEVLKGGILSVDAAATVYDGVTASASVIGSSAVINGGTLKYTAATEVGTVPTIAAVLALVSSGELDLTGLTLSSLKPSDLAGVTGITPSKRLRAPAGANESAGATLSIPAGAIITIASTDTLAAIAGAISVAGELDIGASSTLAVAGSISTSGTGKVVSTTTTPATLANLLGKAGTALTIEQGDAVTLAAATEVKAGTKLTLVESGKITAESASNSQALTVAGQVILDGGTLATAGSHADTGDFIISGAGSITAGGIVISGAGAVNLNTASGSFLAEDVLTLANNTTVLLTESAQIQAGGANGITFKAGSYVFGSGVNGVLSTADVKPTLAVPGTADILAIGDTVASELVFGSNSVYKPANTTATITPGATTTANDNVKLTFKAGAQVVSGTGASTGSSAALTTAGAVSAADTTYTVGADTTVTKTANAKTWSGTIGS